MIDPADMEGLEAALNNNNVSSEEICQLFFFLHLILSFDVL